MQNFKSDKAPSWDNMNISCRVVIITVADHPAKWYWARHLVGQQRQALEVETPNSTFFYIDNADGLGIHKVTTGGHMQIPHRSLTPEPYTAITAVKESEVVYPDKLKMDYEKWRIEAICRTMYGDDYVVFHEKMGETLKKIKNGTYNFNKQNERNSSDHSE